MSKHKDRENLKHSGKLHWYHWLVVIASLVLTVSAWYITSTQAQQKTEIQFNFQADQIVELVKERMGKYEDGLWSGVAALHAQSRETDVYRWRAFSQALSIEEKYPGINGMGIIDYVSPSNLESYLAKQRELRPDYKIHPPHQKNEYWPITHIEPVSTNKKAVGLDMAHETNRYTAAKKARDTGMAQITGPIVLVQDAKKTPGFLFYAPYYEQIDPPSVAEERQQQFIGVVYAPFIMEKLMQGTLQNKNRLVNFSINDGQELLYDELHHGSEDYDAKPLFFKTVSIEMYGRTWSFDIQSSDIFRQQQTSSQPLMILIGGIIIDSMLFGLFLVLTGSNKKAIALANEMTQEFQTSEARLKITIDSMMDALITIDHSNQILSFNKAAENMFGYQADEVIGKSISVLKTPESGGSKGHVGHYLDVSNKGFANDRGIFKVCNKHGDTFPIDLAINEAKCNSGDYFIAVARDISVKMETEDALTATTALLDTAVHASSAGFAIIDRAGAFVEINRALCQWLGFEHDELKGKPYLTIAPEADKMLSQLNFEKMLNGETRSFHAERQYQHKNGPLMWGLVSGAVVKDKNGQVSHIVFHIADIQKERELLADLVQQNKALEKSNADLEQFAYIASHDLKSPLNAIQQLVGWIEEDCKEVLPKTSKKHLSLLMGRSRRMTQLLEDLLDYARVGRYDYKDQSVNLKTLAEDQFHLIAAPHQFTCKADDVDLVIPKTPIEIILRNLLANAVKHHDLDKGEIIISYAKDNGNNRITVTDDGPGIPPDMQEKVLEMFQTLKPRDEVEGSGMGLAIVKRIITHYQGELIIESDGIRGTSFILLWPMTSQMNPKTTIKLVPSTIPGG